MGVQRRLRLASGVRDRPEHEGSEAVVLQSVGTHDEVY